MGMISAAVNSTFCLVFNAIDPIFRCMSYLDPRTDSLSWLLVSCWTECKWLYLGGRDSHRQGSKFTSTSALLVPNYARLAPSCGEMRGTPGPKVSPGSSWWSKVDFPYHFRRKPSALEKIFAVYSIDVRWCHFAIGCFFCHYEVATISLCRMCSGQLECRYSKILIWLATLEFQTERDLLVDIRYFISVHISCSEIYLNEYLMSKHFSTVM